MASPPAPPLASVMAIDEPAVVMTATVSAAGDDAGEGRSARTGDGAGRPAGAAAAEFHARTRIWLVAGPLSPDSASPVAAAPELPIDSASASTSTSPVSPEPPELPEPVTTPLRSAPLLVTTIGLTTAMPKRLVLEAVWVAVTAPVSPVVPELPERPEGLEAAVLAAPPVAPSLVALVWATAAPVAPEVATGLAVTSRSPPSPPSAEARWPRSSRRWCRRRRCRCRRRRGRRPPRRRPRWRTRRCRPRRRWCRR